MKDTENLIPKVQEPKIASLKEMFRYASKLDYLLLVIGLFATIGHALLPGFLALQMGYIFNGIDATSSLDEFYEAEVGIAKMLFTLGIMALFIGIIAVTCYIRVGTDQSLQFRYHYFRALINKPLSYYDKKNAMQMAGSIDMECSTIEQAAGEKIMVFFDAIFMFINSWFIAFYVSAQLGLLALFQLPIQIFAGKIIEGSGMKAVFRLQAAYRDAGGFSEEALYEVRTIAAYNNQESMAKQYQDKLRPCLEMQTRDGFTFGLGWSLYYATLFIFQGLLFWLASVLMTYEQENWLTGEELAPGFVITLFFAVGVSSHQLGNALPALQYLTKARTSVATMLPIIDAPIDEGGNIEAVTIKGKITFEKVSFSYPSNPDNLILKNFSLNIDPGQVVALVGPTGCGKSTIINLIEQFYGPDSGTIYVDNVDSRNFNTASLRSHIGIVSQEPILFNASIKQNILVGRPYATDRQIVDAAKSAGIHDIIIRLPQQYDTLVGPKGSQLSGGQKQRIAIARAIIRNPKILLLDEATSALDNKTQAEVQETLNKLMEGRTTIMVAQRVSTVRKAHMICVMDGGRIQDMGTHEELISREGIYANFVKMQAAGDEDKGVEKKEQAAKKAVEANKPVVGPEAQDAVQESVFIRVLGLITAYWKWLLVAFVCAILAGGLFPTFGFIFALNVTILLSSETGDMIAETATNIIYLIIEAFLVMIALTFLTGSLSRTTALFTFDLRFRCLNSILNYDTKFFDSPSNHPAVLSTRLSTDCSRVNAIGGPVLGVQVLAIAAIFIAVCIGGQFSLSLSILVACCLPLIFIGQRKGRMAQIRGFALVSHDRATTVASDSMLNLRTVQAYNYQGTCLRNYYQGAQAVATEAKKQALVSGFYFGYMILTLYFMYGLASWYGAYLVKYDGLPFEYMVFAFFSTQFATWAMTIVSALAPDIEGGIVAAKNLFKTIDYKPIIDATSSVGLKNPLDGDIEFRNVSFIYPMREIKVLNSVSFSLNPGESLGIAGTTGSGKSTIAQLLLRFYDPTEGSILLNGVDMKSWNLAHARDEIAWVGQEPVLFTGTIKYNLKFGNAKATDSEILEACRMAQAIEFIDKYEDGLNRNVGMKGQNLSGGQKQRIGIARALLKKPKILILDEATSALDTSTERNVQEAIDNLRISVVSIAHRLSTIKNCTNIMLLELGNIVEFGAHDDLVARKGMYHALLTSA